MSWSAQSRWRCSPALLLFIVWLAGLSNKATKCYDIYFTQARRRPHQGLDGQLLGRPGRPDRARSSLLPDRPEFVWVRIDVDDETPVLQGTTAQIKGVGFTGVSEIQLDGAVKGGRPLIAQAGPQGCPVIPAKLGRPRRAAQHRAGADRPHPAADRAADRAAVRQEPELDLRHPRECRARPPEVLAQRAPDLADAIGDARIAARNAGDRRPATSACSPTAPTSWSTSRASRPRRIFARRSPRSSSAADNLDAMIGDARPGIQNLSKIDASRGQPPGPRPARAVDSRSSGFSERLEQERDRRSARAREASRLQAGGNIDDD